MNESEKKQLGEMPIRVLHVVGAMNRGGAESMLMSLYRGLDKTKTQFDFLEFTHGATDFSGEIQELGGRILKCKWTQIPSHFRSTQKAVAQLIRDEGPYAAVHSHTLFASGAVLNAARVAGVPVRIAHAHNTSDVGTGVAKQLYRAAARWLIRRNATARVACSPDAGRYLFGPRFFANDGVIVPNSVDLKRFRPQAPATRERREPTTKKVTLVSVARFEPVKNHHFLVELAEELRAREVEFVMKFVGHGSLQSAITAEIDERDLGDRVEMLGLRSDVEEILRGSDALLMPSLWEGLPVTLVEAQATGLPCLVSEAVTRDADLGLGLLNYLPIDSVSAWAGAIEAGFRHRPTASEIQDALGARGYTVEASLDKLLPLYTPGESTRTT
ncbi:glycosyltransferase [Microbacterium alcoholitolerans]|uniref:glycosyltransferase n=1 Tax=unclassified Microbacterium TaxID=2609290 RepID=UPI003D167A6E